MILILSDEKPPAYMSGDKVTARRFTTEDKDFWILSEGADDELVTYVMKLYANIIRRKAAEQRQPKRAK